MSPEPTPWVPFAFARAEVARALGYDVNAAAEWLRREALAGRARVRFSRYYLERHPINVRLNGHPSHSNEEERQFPRRYWFPPVDEMKDSPAAMEHYHVIHHTEWDAGMLSLALSAEAAKGVDSPTSGAPAPAPRRARGGRRPAEAWWRAMVEVGAWLRDHGEPETLAEVERYLAGRLTHHGSEDNAESLVRDRARLALNTFTAWKAGN